MPGTASRIARHGESLDLCVSSHARKIQVPNLRYSPCLNFWQSGPEVLAHFGAFVFFPTVSSPRR